MFPYIMFSLDIASSVSIKIQIIAINMFIKTVLREKKLPFEIKIDSFYSESNIKYLEKIIEDINNGKAKLEEHELIEEEEN